MSELKEETRKVKMPRLTDAEVAAIAARAGAASEGPWRWGKNYYGGDGIMGPKDSNPVNIHIASSRYEHTDVVEGCQCNIYSQGCIEKRADSVFIAEARTDIPRLLADRATDAVVIERLTYEVARLQGLNSAMITSQEAVVAQGIAASLKENTAKEDRLVLWAHLVSEHAGIFQFDSLAELQDMHNHEHKGPCTIRNHPPEARNYSFNKISQVLSEFDGDDEAGVAGFPSAVLRGAAINSLNSYKEALDEAISTIANLMSGRASQECVARILAIAEGRK